MPGHSVVGTQFVTGCYTADAGGGGIGIESFELASDGALLWLGTAVVAHSPSFAATHPTLPVLYVIAEQAATLAAYVIDDAQAPRTGLPLGEPWPTGSGPCHVVVDPDGRFLIVACWGDGSVLCYELDEEGRILCRLDGAPAVDPWLTRSRARRDSRAHASLVLPDGRVVTTDLGYDLLRIWSYSPCAASASASITLDHEVTLPFASGPRHLVRHHSGAILVLTEHSIEVVSLREQGDGRLAVSAVRPATVSAPRSGDAAAEIALSPDGRHAYVGVRGSNLISTLQVDDSGNTRAIASIPSGGLWPRHHVVIRGYLLVANEGSEEITVFAIDRDSGLPEGPVFRLSTGSPTVLVPLRS